MEEHVGMLWHRLVSRAAHPGHPGAAVELGAVQHTLGIYFRALGGDGGLRVEAGEGTDHGARRGWLQRVAGTARKTDLAWRDARSLHLPQRIDHFPRRALNRELYLWLAALAARDDASSMPWLERNQALTRDVLARYPGLEPRYRRLVAAHLQLRPDPHRLAPDEAAQESAIRRALADPGSVGRLPVSRRAPWPVPLWLHPSPPGAQADRTPGEDSGEGGGADARSLDDDRRRRAERSDTPDNKAGLITIRMENILTWGEFARVDRATDDNEDLDQAADAAREMETINVTRQGKAGGKRLRFDLDLPSEALDDRVLGEGIRLPEWDWKRRELMREHCRLVPMEAADAAPMPLPRHLGRTAKRLRAQFEQLRPGREWRRAQPDGQEVDLDAYLRFAADRRAGQIMAADGLYRDLRSGARDLACLLLADLSLSTDTYIDNHQRVIDVIRDSLFLFAESLSATGDRFGLYGFSSRKRDPVRFHHIKGFDQAYDNRVRGRIQAVKPGYYTRMGAALRHATTLLQAQPAERRLLLLLSDGKPNDLDRYEGRHGIEDTRHAVQEARRAGLQPFCVTVDEKGSEYLPYLFGSGGYVVIRRPQELPRKLPALYARLTRS
jgi:nitric oxide reductase NorD protein